MAGNRQLYEAVMRQGDDAALEERWEAAIENYMKAVREFPNSLQACNSLGLALFNAGRLEDALRVYGQSNKLDPNDPLPIEKSGDVYERMGRLNDAARQYVTAAEMYITQQDLEKAIDNWEHATRITPGLVKINQKLAAAYERTGQRGEAVNEYLKLAFHFQNSANNSKVAMQALERALRLDSKDPRVMNAMTAVRASRPIDPKVLEAPKRDDKGKIAEDNVWDFPTEAIADERGPMGEAVDEALETLAEQVFSAGMMDMSAVNAIQGIEMHRAGIHDEAVGGYERAFSAGMKSPALLFNLGVMYYETNQPDKALPVLRQVKGDFVLMAGASHTLSLCLGKLEKWSEAAKAHITTLRTLDLALAMDEQETAEVNQFYTQVLQLAEQTDLQTLRNFSLMLEDALSGDDWKRTIADTSNLFRDLVTEDPKTALETISRGKKVIETMSRVDAFASRKQYHLAMDEAQRVIQQAPDYLAAHLRIAQLLMEMSRIEQATTKYNLIARTYLLRGNQSKAAEILNEVLRIAPADITLRTNLIELLEQQERWSESLDQYIALAKAYRDLADMTNARLTFDLATKIAKQRNAPPEKLADIQYALGELDMDRLDFRTALRNFQKVLEIDANNLSARRRIVDLQYRLNNPLPALEELDKLLQIYARQKRPDLILEVLEEQTELNPSDMGLRQRLGAVYQQMSKPDKAIEQYDQLADLQMEAGLNDEAAKTVKRIISLNPPRVDDYKQLLQQLNG